MSKSLLVFPALYPIKIMGENSPKFTEDIKEILNNAHRSKNPIKISYIQSRNANYVSINANIFIQNHAELNELYQKIQAHPLTRMVL